MKDIDQYEGSDDLQPEIVGELESGIEEVFDTEVEPVRKLTMFEMQALDKVRFYSYYDAIKAGLLSHDHVWKSTTADNVDLARKIKEATTPTASELQAEKNIETKRRKARERYHKVKAAK